MALYALYLDLLMFVYGSVEDTVVELFCYCGVCFIIFISLIRFVFK